MKQLLSFILLSLLVFNKTRAQHNNEFYNNSALVHIQFGADMYILGDMHMAGGASTSLENNGFIEVEGNLYGTTLFQQRGTGTLLLRNRLVNIGEIQTIYGTNSYVVRGGQAQIGVNDGSFYILQLANDQGTVYLSGGGNVCDVRNSVNFRPIIGLPVNRIITAEPPPTLLPTNGSGYPSVFGIMNTAAPIATVMPNNTITTNGNSSTIDNGYIQGKLRRAISSFGGTYGFPLGLEPAGPTIQRGVQFSELSLSANTYDVVTGYFETGSSNVVAGTPVECGGNTINYFGGADHGEWMFDQEGSNTGTFSYRVWPQDYNFPSLGLWVITKDNQLLGTADECGVTVVGLTRSGYSGLNGAEFDVAGPVVVLPLELIEFKAYAVNNEFIKTSWISASEQNTAYFQVERSTDAISFSPIGNVLAAGFSNQLLNYFFDDRNVQANIMYYYRLKMVDRDSSYTYSPIRNAIITATAESNVLVYPNPITNNEIGIVLQNIKGDVRINLYNDIGQLMYNKVYNVTNDIEMIQINNVELAKGIYIISINNNENNWTNKVFKN